MYKVLTISLKTYDWRSGILINYSGAAGRKILEIVSKLYLNTSWDFNSLLESWNHVLFENIKAGKIKINEVIQYIKKTMFMIIHLFHQLCPGYCCNYLVLTKSQISAKETKLLANTFFLARFSSVYEQIRIL